MQKYGNIYGGIGDDIVPARLRTQAPWSGTGIRPA
jgi:hypothetical protein